MPGEHTYSQEAVQALRDHYYNAQPRPHVDDMLTAATRRDLGTINPTIQAEIAQISRSRAYELIRTDPRYTDTHRREHALQAIRNRIDHLATTGIEGWGKARELDKLLETLDNAQTRQTQATPPQGEGGRLAKAISNSNPTTNHPA